MSHAERPRGFTIGDLLVLIAGLASAMALVRATSPSVTPSQFLAAIQRPQGGWSPWYAFALTTELGVIFGIPFLAGWTPACLLLQLRAPRPPWRRLRRRPGFVVSLIATCGLIAMIAVVGVLVATGTWQGSLAPEAAVGTHMLGGLIVGPGVTAGWSTMTLCGISRPAPAWADRLGRMTGALWVALGAISVSFAALALP